MRVIEFSDDTLLYLGLSTSSLQTAMSRLECCLSSLHAWFCCNGMCHNPMKSEATLLGSSRCLQSYPVIRDVSIASSVLPTADKVTTRGVILDSKLTFDAHISAVCKNAHFTSELYAISDPPSPPTWPLPLQSPWYSHANSLYRVSTRNIHKLQRCQNTAGRLILQQSFTPSIQDLMNQLH